ncbi:(Fe-S)-binding protein [Paenibacillus sedimenti]|uniref:Glycolate oxidase iron-sulfur subunit n=1 Tax=Paenibacillus sedimenti TaxID=2770274 RepID=A0A926KRC0_9BACL|nr:(Fe-S)-binding protein [Paenibacillus sedimenti]MBD0382667.1 4Fe-4S dicluster domain-containing protein [Paenibacillus sedimenti]
MSEATSIKHQLAAASPNPLAERLKLTLNYDELSNCIRCGFCQPSCPTFKETGLEAASPRGRIALMKAVVDDLMVPDSSFQKQMDLCLGCRACEPVCPADVKYGQLLEQTRDAIEKHTDHRWWIKPIRNLAFQQLFPNQKRMRLLGSALRLFQRSGIQRLVRKSGMMNLFPETMSQMERILPEASSKGVIEQLGTYVPAAGNRKPIATVGMFRGCIMDVLFTETNMNTVKLLSEAGFDVIIPPTQNCCGALHAHSGELDQAKDLAKKNIDAFQASGVDYIISNAGGCGALLVEYGHLLHDDPEYADAALKFAGNVKDVSQMLMEKGSIPEFSIDKAAASHGQVSITYQDSCHLRNVMKAGNAPRDLMNRIEGAKLVELRGADRCCGSAGIYNLVQPEMSMDILDHKMEHVKETHAHYLLTSNPGCLLQMKLGIEREQMSGQMKAVHIVDFLYEHLANN